MRKEDYPGLVLDIASFLFETYQGEGWAKVPTAGKVKVWPPGSGRLDFNARSSI